MNLEAQREAASTWTPREKQQLEQCEEAIGFMGAKETVFLVLGVLVVGAAIALVVPASILVSFASLLLMIGFVLTGLAIEKSNQVVLTTLVEKYRETRRKLEARFSQSRRNAGNEEELPQTS